MIKKLAKLLKVLNSEADPSQTRPAINLSMLSDFLLFFSLLNLY
jgi:hypothetical protein